MRPFSDRFKLLFGPYSAPIVPRHGYLICKMRGPLLVGDWTEAPISWPCKWGTASPILCGDLLRAVKREAKATVAFFWGVSFATVNKWRKAVTVPRWNKGSSALLKSARAQSKQLRASKSSAKRLKPGLFSYSSVGAA